MMMPSMGHQWTIDDPSMGIELFGQKIRSTWPCSKFQQNFSILSFSFSQFKLWDFEGAQIFYSEMKLYIVIHIIYLCEKPDSVDFPRKKHQIF